MQKSNSYSILLIKLFIYVIAGIHIYYLYYGLSTIVSTIFIYLAIFLVIDFLISIFLGKKWKKNVRRLSYWAIFISILILDLFLRLFYKDNIQPAEADIFGHYHSQYRNILWENKINKDKSIKRDVGIKLHIPNSERNEITGEFNYIHTYNSFGLRSSQFDTIRLDTSITILGLGDSFTEGVGTPQDSTWVQLLENNIKKTYLNTLSLNGGYLGSDPYYEFYKLEKDLIKLNPDVVILVINESDLHDVLIRGGMERFVNNSTIKYNNPPWWEYIYSFSFITRFIIHDILHFDWQFKSRSNYEKIKYQGIDQICDCIINQFNPLALKSNFEFIPVYIPILDEVRYNLDNFSRCQKKLKEHNIAFINLFSEFQILDKKIDSYYWPIDHHPNSKGYNYVATCILDEILDIISDRNCSE